MAAAQHSKCCDRKVVWVQVPPPAQMKKKVLVILGSTASGKSDLAVKLAKKFNGEIISADSRQVYKGLNIGTGKITKKEMRGIPHYLLDVTDPKKQFSVSDFVSKANEALKLIEAHEAFPIVVGGTGFYIDALAGNVSLPNVPPNKALRNRLNKLDRKKLFRMLEKKDSRRAKTIDPHNKVRLIRALEIVEALGRVPKTSEANKAKKPRSFVYIGLKPKDLDKRIEKRVKNMFKGGLLKEIAKLKKAGITNKRLKQFGFEYWQPTEGRVIRATRQYAKRQMTWFKRNKKIKWFEPGEFSVIEKYAKVALKGD